MPQLNLAEYFTFGRLRPLHTNAVIFAFVGNGIFAGVYYSLQRLLRTRMFSDTLSKIHFWGWQAIIVAAAITLPLGMTTGKEYAELEWPIDIAITLIWVVFGINMIGTILRRRERHLYVAIWFYIATWVTVAMLHIVNSIELPISLESPVATCPATPHKPAAHGPCVSAAIGPNLCTGAGPCDLGASGGSGRASPSGGTGDAAGATTSNGGTTAVGSAGEGGTAGSAGEPGGPAEPPRCGDAVTPRQLCTTYATASPIGNGPR
jgi:hypothetical protein